MPTFDSRVQFVKYHFNAIFKNKSEVHFSPIKLFIFTIVAKIMFNVPILQIYKISLYAIQFQFMFSY
jgi:hypothetical protein